MEEKVLGPAFVSLTHYRQVGKGVKRLEEVEPAKVPAHALTGEPFSTVMASMHYPGGYSAGAPAFRQSSRGHMMPPSSPGRVGWVESLRDT